MMKSKMNKKEERGKRRAGGEGRGCCQGEEDADEYGENEEDEEDEDASER